MRHTADIQGFDTEHINVDGFISVLHISHAALILLPTACNLENYVIFHVFKNLPMQLPEDVVRACGSTLVIFYRQSGKK